MRRIADGEDYMTPATIDDPTTLGEMGDVLRELGMRGLERQSTAREPVLYREGDR